MTELTFSAASCAGAARVWYRNASTDLRTARRFGSVRSIDFCRESAAIAADEARHAARYGYPYLD